MGWMFLKGWLYLSLEHLEVVVGLLIGLISVWLGCYVSGNREDQKEGERVGEWLVGGAIRTHNIYPLVHHLILVWFMAPQNTSYSHIKDH